MSHQSDLDDIIALYLQGEGFEAPPPERIETDLEVSVTLERRISISPTAYVFVISYAPEYERVFNCHVFAHFAFHGEHHQPLNPGYWNGVKFPVTEDNKITRKFTPIFIDRSRRELHFLIRIYRCCDLFPDGGKFTRYLESVKPKEHLTINPSPTKIELIREGVIKDFKGEKPFKTLNIIAGGTGITPYVRFLIQNKTSKVNLLYYNKTLKEILLKPLLDTLQKRGLLVVKYIVTSEDPAIASSYRPCDGDDVSFGKMSREHIEGFFEKDNSFTLFCGPPGMNTKAHTLLTELGLQ